MKEVRIGLVLYGGVALAVYINGVVTEFWQALRASRASHQTPPEKLSGTAGIYGDLLAELARRKDTTEIRVVIDSVAGTSAGGVNGASLFKAIVEGADATILNRVWLEDADISNLKGEPDSPNLFWRSIDAVLGLLPFTKKYQSALAPHESLDWRWVRNTIYTLLTSKDGQRTPLKGGFFTEIISRSLAEMSHSEKSGSLLPNRGTFDLFLTRTDLHGWPRHLPVSPDYHREELYERTHAHVMTFSVRPGVPQLGLAPKNPVTDFDLTYGARTTAGFPFAFAPLTYQTTVDDFLAGNPAGEVRPPDEFHDMYLREHVLMKFPTERARMVDGGVLDNRPFTHVTRAIERKPADHEVKRVVAYIEPDPEKSDPDPEKKFGHPLPLDPRFFDQISSLFKLFRHEPILGDLRTLQARNATVRRIVAYREHNQAAAVQFVDGILAGLHGDATPDRLNTLQQMANETLTAEPLSGYAGYVGMKLRATADMYSDVLCRAVNTPYDSRQAFSVRRLVRHWMETDRGSGEFGSENVLDPGAVNRPNRLTDSQLLLLRAFDIPFRLRRVRTIVRFINAQYDSVPDRRPLDKSKRLLADIVLKYEAALDDPETDRAWIDTITQIVLDTPIEKILESLSGDPESLVAEYGGVLDDIFHTLSSRFVDIGEELNNRLSEAIHILPDAVRNDAVRELVAFPFHDVSLFPLMDTAGVSDLIVVDTLRVSPYDAEIAGKRAEPLESAGMGAFEGFLDRELREIDLLYGRLNGAERIIEIMTKSAAHDPQSAGIEELRRDFTRRAAEQILSEADAPPHSRFGKAIAAIRAGLG